MALPDGKCGPQGLKPSVYAARSGTAEAVPYPNPICKTSSRVGKDQDMEHAETAGNKIVFSVWFGLLGLTVLEVILAYRQLPLETMLSILMTLSVIKAALIIAYFMHLRYEQASLFVTLIPALVFILIMMTVIFADSSRLAHMRSLVQ
jgi:cytochrome c oxidase subunit IV